MKLSDKKAPVWPIALSLILMLLSLLLIFFLGRNATDKSKTNVPAAQYSEKLIKNIYLSKLNLLDTASSMEKGKVSYNQTLWENNIIPTLEKLKKIGQEWNDSDIELLFETERLVYSLEANQLQVYNLIDNSTAAQSLELSTLIENKLTPLIEKIDDRIMLLNTSQLAQLERKASNTQILNWMAIVGLIVFTLILSYLSIRNSRKSLSLSNNPERVPHNMDTIPSTVKIDNRENAGPEKYSHSSDITDISAQNKDSAHKNLTKIKSQIQKIANGDFSGDYTPANDADDLGIALQQMTINLREKSEILAQNVAESRAIIDSASNGVITMNSAEEIQSFNKAAEALFQYKEEEVLGKSMNLLLADAQSENTVGNAAVEEKANNFKTSAQGTKRIARKKDGTQFLIHLSLVEVVVNDKRILTGIARDLSEELQQQKEIEKRTQDIEKQNWIKTSISKVYDATKGIQNINDLTDTLTRVICEQLQASVGTFYLSENLFYSKSGEMLLYGSYAFKNPNSLPNSFKLGEGLIGQCAREGKSIVITDVPEDYLEINSGIGKTKPNEITIVPIKHNEETIGVMEFGTTYSFSSDKQEFIEEICTSIGVMIKGIVERAKTEELSTEINNQISAINRSNAAIEFDLDGNILTANNLFLDLMGYSLDEIKGKHHKIFVERVFAQSNEYKAFWKELKVGEFKQGEFERRKKSNEAVWIQGSYNPILNVDGQPYKILKVAVDITKQKEQQIKTEELSVEINNQISAINRSNAAIEFDLDGNVLTANDLFLDLMGYRLEEIKGKHHKIFVANTYSRTTDYKNFWKELKQGVFKQGEFERRGKDNRSVWIQGSYNPILGVDGLPYKVLKVAVDITKQKEQQIKTQELSVEVNNQISAINRSNAAIEFDLDGFVLTANDLFLDLMGYSLDEIKGEHHRIFVENTYAKSIKYKDFWRELKEGGFKQGEFERRNKNKENVWIQGSYNPILDAEGLPYKVLKIAVDITKQKNIQLEVQKQKEVVEAQEEELRVSNEELSRQANQLQASEEEMRQQQDELEKANVMLEEKAQELEEQHLTMVGKNTALEQAQAALVLKTEELEKSGRYKSEFLANMSHELRTPLNSVIILSKLLQGNKTNNLNEKQIEFAQIINKSGEDLLSLINEVLDLAKVESGKIELEMESLLLNEYAEDSKRTFVAIAQDKGVDFILDIDEKLPETFTTDKQRLNQVVKNLLSNAFKFTEEKGKVTLAFKNCKALSKFTSPELLKCEQVLQIAVTDTGIGIAPEKLQSVFEAFVQEDGTTQRKYGGTGLGLSISKELVKLLGGEIYVESEVGKGSTFMVYLPFKNSQNLQQELPAIEAKDPIEVPQKLSTETATIDEQAETTVLKGVPNEKLEAVIADDRNQLQKDDNIILVVEDDLQFAKVLLDQARENGFKVVVTDQGDKALQHVEEYKPNAIILDMQLPVMDGWTVLKKLKANEKYAHIPVHVISGMDKTKLGLELGAVEYLIKPIALDTLERTFFNISKTISGEEMKKVLIIEDDELNNQALQEMIKSKHLEAISAKNAKDARTMFKKENPDLVVLDLGLPDVDGIELLGELKTQKKEVPVIVFTGKELTKKELKQIERHKDTSVVLKTSKSYDRLSEETELFMNMLNATQTEFPVLPPKEFASDDIIKGKRILIVDDDMRNIYALETILEEEQVLVTVATNGQEAVEEIKNGEFDAVLMDIMMPVMDGYEATQKIREMGHTKLPIIALTAKAMKGDREKCLEAGVSDYMSKPLDVEKLMSLLRVWLYN